MNWRKVLFFGTIGWPLYLLFQVGRFIGDLLHWNESTEDRTDRRANEY